VTHPISQPDALKYALPFTQTLAVHIYPPSR
jgi:hypothetical protein